MTPTRRYTPVEWGGLIVAAVVTALGATMIIAWEFELVGLLKLVNTGPALHFNTAVLFVLSGLMLASSILGHRWTAEGIALAVFLLSLLYAAKRLNIVGLDFEHLFFRPSETLIDRVGSGKVALGTSVSLLLLSLSVLAQHRLRQGPLVALLLGTVVCVISSAALNHYLMGTGVMSGWSITAGLAFLTASALFLMGAVAIGLSCGPHQSCRSTHWLSYSLALALAAFSFLIWRELIANETIHLKREAAAAAAGVRLQLHERLHMRLKTVERFSQRWSSLDRAAQSQDARRILEDFEGILALNWITADLRVGWICSRENRQDLVDKPLPFGPRHAAVGRARETGRFIFTPVLELLHGESGFIGYVPTLDQQGKIHGFIAAVFPVGMTFDGIASDRRHSGFEFSVTDHGRQV